MRSFNAKYLMVDNCQLISDIKDIKYHLYLAGLRHMSNWVNAP